MEILHDLDQNKVSMSRSDRMSLSERQDLQKKIDTLTKSIENDRLQPAGWRYSWATKGKATPRTEGQRDGKRKSSQEGSVASDKVRICQQHCGNLGVPVVSSMIEYPVLFAECRRQCKKAASLQTGWQSSGTFDNRPSTPSGRIDVPCPGGAGAGDGGGHA
jgi:hypothetical protein